MVRTMYRVFLALMCVVVSAGAVLAAQNVQKGTAAAPKKKDPVEDAFKLPKGITLFPEQQKAFDDMKAKKEPELKAALEKVASATDTTAKTAAAKEMMKVRQEINTEKATILKMKPSTPPTPANNGSNNRPNARNKYYGRNNLQGAQQGAFNQ